MDTAFLLPLASSIHRPVQSTIGHLRLSRAKGVIYYTKYNIILSIYYI